MNKLAVQDAFFTPEHVISQKHHHAKRYSHHHETSDASELFLGPAAEKEENKNHNGAQIAGRRLAGYQRDQNDGDILAVFFEAFKIQLVLPEQQHIERHVQDDLVHARLGIQSAVARRMPLEIAVQEHAFARKLPLIALGALCARDKAETGIRVDETRHGIESRPEYNADRGKEGHGLEPAGQKMFLVAVNRDLRAQYADHKLEQRPDACAAPGVYSGEDRRYQEKNAEIEGIRRAVFFLCNDQPAIQSQQRKIFQIP